MTGTAKRPTTGRFRRMISLVGFLVLIVAVAVVAAIVMAVLIDLVA